MSKQLSYKKLNELFDEMSDALTDTIEDNQRMQTELKYLKDFVAWKSLTSEYQDFRENAFLDPSDELPFPNYIM